MNKQRELNKIAKVIEACEICKAGKSGKAVPGEGNPDADIVFIGEAPGRTEAQCGRPFIGRCGKLLRTLIVSTGLKEKDVFLASPVKYLPDRGTPSMSDITHGRLHLDEQFRIIDPKLIVLLGRVAVLGVLQRLISITAEHGRVIESGKRKYFVTYHPAAALRFPRWRAGLKEDFQTLTELINKFF